ncbi:MAG: C10 family peptidase [Bacteroidota bacterium]|nr:C10 family peptidase [Bacteroidota bacterium]
MKIKFLLIVLLLGGMGFLNAKEVPQHLAEKVAKNFFYQHVNQVKSMEYADINLSLVSVNNKEAHTTYYAFDINNNQGFILVSADDGAKPVLAYAFKGHFNEGNMHPGQAEMLDWYANQIAYIANNNITSDKETTSQWQALSEYTPEKGIKTLRNVEPLLLSEWNQGYPYNQMCPEDPDGIAGHVPVGCVATAMGQVMKYWDYPETGTGSKTHWSYNYGSFTVNFANQTYNWAGIPLSGNGLNDELAKINFHMGVAVEMQWGPDGSGSQTSKVVTALEDYFQYDESCQLVNKSSYTDAEYKDILRTQLDNQYPMVYSGTPESGFGGHAWNCDGYMNDEFHMNWGWGSNGGNGYYTLDDLTSTATPSGPENNFVYNQQVVKNIYPKDNYPEYCTGTKNINYHQGAFGDGSANEDYQNNISCQYLISPDCGQIITLNFEQFDLADGDVIHIYDGETTGAPLLETFDMDNIPTSSVQVNYGNLLIEFLTDGSNTAGGWYVTFNSDYCKTGLSHTSLTGTVSDGSGPCNYNKSTVCSWYIEPNNAESIHLDFTEFDFGGSIDYLDVFRNDASDLVEKFDATNTPTELIVNAPVVFLQFFADSDDDVGGGFTIDYTTTVGMDDSEILKGTTVFPNPATNQINLGFSLMKPSQVEIRMYDLLGKKVGTATVEGIKGYQKLEIDELIELPGAGVFLMDVVVGNQKTTKRISIIR